MAMALYQVKLCALTLGLLICFMEGLEAQKTDGCSHLIASRAVWGARPPNATSLMNLPVPNVVIHHAAGPPCSTREACIRVVKGIQVYHMDAPTHKWSDVGYSFLVGGDGQVYEGRGWSRTGAHSPRYNDKSIGICFLGNFAATLPPQIQLNAAKKLIECGVANGMITNNYNLYGHRDVRRATECPGNRLYQEISNWPNKAAPLKNKF